MTTSLWNFMRYLSARRDTKHHGLRIIRVDVEDRRLEHLRHVAAVDGRARVARIGGREANLVVDDEVHRAAGVVAARLRQLQGLHDHALAGKGGIAVHQHRQHLVALLVAAPLLARAHRAFDHRIDDLEVRGVEGEHRVHVAARGPQVGREALVVLHVARALAACFRSYLPSNSENSIRRRLAQQIDQHIQPAAVGHADDDFLDAGRAALSG